MYLLVFSPCIAYQRCCIIRGELLRGRGVLDFWQWRLLCFVFRARRLKHQCSHYLLLCMTCFLNLFESLETISAALAFIALEKCCLCAHGLIGTRNILQITVTDYYVRYGSFLIRGGAANAPAAYQTSCQTFCDSWWLLGIGSGASPRWGKCYDGADNLNDIVVASQVSEYRNMILSTPTANVANSAMLAGELPGAPNH